MNAFFNSTNSTPGDSGLNRDLFYRLRGTEGGLSGMVQSSGMLPGTRQAFLVLGCLVLGGGLQSLAWCLGIPKVAASAPSLSSRREKD